MAAVKLTANIGESAEQKATTTVETVAPITSENVSVTNNSEVTTNQGEEEKVKTVDT